MTIDGLMELGLGRLGMSVDDFWAATPRELANKGKGFHGLENERRREFADFMRWQTAMLLSPYAKKGQTIKPTDLLKFEWDVKKIEKMTEVDKQMIRDKFGKTCK